MYINNLKILHLCYNVRNIIHLVFTFKINDLR